MQASAFYLMGKVGATKGNFTVSPAMGKFCFTCDFFENAG